MKKIAICLCCVFIFGPGTAQNSYKDSLDLFIQTYVKDHQVVSGDDKKRFSFYPVSEKYRVLARFTPVENSPWTDIPTSSGKPKKYRIYGWLDFDMEGSKQKLAVYQSQFLLQHREYFDYLFLPFKDATSGRETYETGRYLDLKISDIKDNKALLDFNKTYNPYCAYVDTGYSCPIPPKENHIKAAIKAGEKKFLKEN